MNFERTRDVCRHRVERMRVRGLKSCSTRLVFSYPRVLSSGDGLVLQLLNLRLDLIAQRPSFRHKLIQGGSILFRERLICVVQRTRVQIGNVRHVSIKASKFVLNAGYLFDESKLARNDEHERLAGCGPGCRIASCHPRRWPHFHSRPRCGLGFGDQPSHIPG